MALRSVASTYASLFSTIGTIHGGGDGATTFNLPDYQGQILVAARQRPKGAIRMLPLAQP